MVKRKFFNRLFEKVLLVVALVIVLFSSFTYANTSTNISAYDSRWVKVGNDWKVLNYDGTYLSNCWFFDTVQQRWYRIGAANAEVLTGSTGYYNQNDSSSMIAGLFTENGTNKSYLFDNFSSLTYGALIETSGYYVINGKTIYLEFEQADASTKGAITLGLSELKSALGKGSEVAAPRAGGGGGGSSSGGGGSSKPVAQKVRKTILLYLVGSDLEEDELSASKSLYEISQYNYPSDVRVIVFTGAARMEKVEKTREKNKDPELKKVFNVNWEKNQIWEARNGISPIEEDFGNDSMTDKNTLLNFLTYVKQYYPSDEYNIILNDHGMGAYGGLGVDTRKEITRKDPLSLADIKYAFDMSDLRFGFIGFDACLMGCVEYLYGFSDYAEYYIGSSELECGSWDYTSFSELAANSKISNEELLKKIIDKYIGKAYLDSNTLALFNLKNFKNDIDESLSAFAKNVYDLSLKDFSSLKELVQARAKTLEYGVTENLDYVDLYDYSVAVNNTNLSNDTKELISNLWNDVKSHILYFKTGRPKDESGKLRVGGVSMYFPLEHVDVSESKGALSKFYSSFNGTYNKDYNKMLRVAATRMALAKKIAELNANDNTTASKKLDDEVIKEAKNNIALTDDEINKIKTNVYPDLLRYRLISTTNSNFSFERSGRPGELLFSYRKHLAEYFKEVYATPITYDLSGKELKLGHVAISHVTIEEPNDIAWNINPREGYWFKIKDSNTEVLSSFYPTELEAASVDTVGENYLFEKTITGYVPAVKIEKDKDGEESERSILIYAKFEEMEDRARILGYTDYYLTDLYEPSKTLFKFNENDKIKPIYNFDDAKVSKKITDKGAELNANSLEIVRGALNNQAISYSYYIYDVFNQKTAINFEKRITFKDTVKEANFSMPQYGTWYDYTYNSANNSINMDSEVDGHHENMSLVINTVPSGNSIYNDFSGSKKEFSNETINYFRVRDFDSIATSSIIINKLDLSNLGLFGKAYVLIMDSHKDIGGTNCAFTKLYVVHPIINTVYLIDATLWAENSSLIYNDRKMLNYIRQMIENKYEEFVSETEIIIQPLVVNLVTTANPTTINAAQNEFGALATISELNVATDSEANEHVATDSEVNVDTEIDLEVNENVATDSEISERVATESGPTGEKEETSESIDETETSTSEIESIVEETETSVSETETTAEETVTLEGETEATAEETEKSESETQVEETIESKEEPTESSEESTENSETEPEE